MRTPSSIAAMLLLLAPSVAIATGAIGYSYFPENQTAVPANFAVISDDRAPPPSLSLVDGGVIALERSASFGNDAGRGAHVYRQVDAGVSPGTFLLETPQSGSHTFTSTSAVDTTAPRFDGGESDVTLDETENPACDASSHFARVHALATDDVSLPQRLFYVINVRPEGAAFSSADSVVIKPMLRDPRFPFFIGQRCGHTEYPLRLEARTTYRYWIAALDEAGNLSAPVEGTFTAKEPTATGGCSSAGLEPSAALGLALLIFAGRRRRVD